MNTDLPNILNRADDAQPPAPALLPDTHLNVLLPSLTFGGAERMVQDLILGLTLRRPAPPIKLFVLNDVSLEYPLPDAENLTIFRLHGRSEADRCRAVALEVLTSPSPAVFTHLIPAKSLRRLWDLGVQTIPVIHNSSPAWQDSPQAFHVPLVPFLVAVSEAVAAQLAEMKCAKPVVVIRHELPYWTTPEELSEDRQEIRARHSIRDDTVLIGMVGQFKAQKAYTRAVRVLGELQPLVKAKLMILGGWDASWGTGRAAYTAVCQQALDLGVMPDLIMPGTVHPVRPYFAAFDVFLNTSIYEGLSIATLEAIQAGCPVVSADAGGNREALPATATLVEDSSDTSAYAEGILRALSVTERPIPAPPAIPDLIPRLWSLLGRYGAPTPVDETSARRGTLFVTDNINFGGPQRSLCNLLAHGRFRAPSCLALLDGVCRGDYLRAVEDAGVLILSLREAGDAVDKAERVLHLIERLGVQGVCFWNADPRVKLLVARVLVARRIRMTDVSPGPMYFDDLAAAADFGRRLAFGAAPYLARLDHFVAKYAGGAPPPEYGVRPDRVTVIPNGVPAAAGESSGPAPALPADADPAFLIGTACRIAPSKRLEYLLEMMQRLGERVPEARLVVVGGVDPRHLPYWERLREMQRAMPLQNVHFVGGAPDVRAWLRHLRLFVMVSDDQGCPNASLEAMAEGLPVIANPSGGTSEQVEDGVNGLLVSGDDPAEMAHSVELLLCNPKLIEAFGRAGRRLATEKFSMDRMASGYAKLLSPS